MKFTAGGPTRGGRCVLKVIDNRLRNVEKCLMSEEAKSDMMRRLILMANTHNLHELLSSSLATLSSVVTQAMPSIGGELYEMLSLTDGFNHKVLQSINQSRDNSSLSTIVCYNWPGPSDWNSVRNSALLSSPPFMISTEGHHCHHQPTVSGPSLPFFVSGVQPPPFI